MCDTAIETGRLTSVRPVWVVLAGVVTMAAAGCRTSGWTPSSSWSMFGSQPKSADPLAVTAAAPAGDITKPSTTAQPYPTTSTPQGYSLAGTQAEAGTPPPADVGPVVYGSTPPPSSPAAVAAAAGRVPDDPASSATPLTAIAPQVGPYASSGRGAANGWAEPPPVATPESTPYPALTPSSTAAPPPARLAENTPSTSWSAAAESAVADAGTSSRYAAGGSRFSTPSAAPVGPVPTEPPTGFQPPLAAPTAASPASPPAAFDPMPPPAAPAATPAVLPTAAPQRRPDPGYRPGGTSSYRPRPDVMTGERTIQPVSFDGSRPPAL